MGLCQILIWEIFLFFPLPNIGFRFTVNGQRESHFIITDRKCHCQAYETKISPCEFVSFDRPRSLVSFVIQKRTVGIERPFVSI